MEEYSDGKNILCEGLQKNVVALLDFLMCLLYFS